jgi:hypothetical protein
VRVDSQLNVPTIYLQWVGVDELKAPAQSAAIEGAGNIEISLVLDISGSMSTVVSDGNTRMDMLKEASTNFVNSMLDPAYEDQISMSLVSYSQHVSLGQNLYSALNTSADTMLADPLASPRMVDSSMAGALEGLDTGDFVTNPARCVDFLDSEFGTTTFNTGRTYQQVEQFEHYTSTSSLQFPLCPKEAHQGIFPLTQTASELTDQIELFEPTSFTSIHLGMKWGVSLLDPSMRPLLENVAGVDPAFAGKRPSNYTSSTGFNTVKYVILMTDGENVAGRRVLPAMYNSDEYSFFWRQTLNTYPYRYWYNNIDDHPTGERPTWAGISHRPYSATDANNQLSSICAAAKEAPANITVYTIAMGSGSTQMDDCASTGKYYQTSGNEIDEIFEEIARQISALRLSL